MDYNLHVDSDDNASDIDDYFSDDEVPADETDEVTDDYFFAHLHDDMQDCSKNSHDPEIDERKTAAMVMPHSVHDEKFDYLVEVHDDTVDSKSNSHDAEIDERKPSAKDMPHFESKHDNSPTDDDRKPAAKASISNNREIEA